jgi:type III secretion protein J
MATRFLKTATALLACVILAGCEAQLFDGLGENEANEIIATLQDNGINATKAAGEEGTYKVNVDEADFSRAVNVLDAYGLPVKAYDRMGEIFKKGGILSTPLEEKVRYMYALQEELAKTLNEIDGVLSARVHIVLPEENEMGENIAPASVSVFIKFNAGADTDLRSRVPDIRQFVLNSIPNVDQDKIHVSLFPAALKSLPPTASRTRSVLGMQVAPGSVGMVWGLTAAVGVLLLALAGGGAYIFISRKRLTATRG